MNDSHDPHDSGAPEDRPPLTVIPVQGGAPAYAPQPSVFGQLLRWLFRMAFMVSLGLNVFLFIILAIRLSNDSASTGTLYERYHSGKSEARDKVAVVKMEGVIMEGLTGFAQKQIEEAAGDDHVKAVVLRINSPGGSITASDDLHRRLVNLRDGTTPGHKSAKKPLVVSMGALAASGGYYIAVPAERLVAERTTITGSIGVYASFPNITGLARTYGFGMEVIKAGEVKDSGSMFKEMSPQERQLWQDMVNHAYDQFLGVVEQGRPVLTRQKLREEIVNRKLEVAGPDSKEKKEVTYVRRRADGGIFTADEALKFELIDQVGYLEDAIQEASKAAGLGEDYKAVVYEKPLSLMDALMRSQARGAGSQLDATKLAGAVAPRLWFLMPQSEMAGLLSAAGRE